MKLLLDTHVALWALLEDSRLSDPVKALITDPENEIFVSVVTVWEIAIKHSLERRGRRIMPISGTRALNAFRDAGYQILPVAAEHAAAVELLPPIHADPFDRLLAAQALHEPLRLITHDATLARYSDTTIQF